MYRIESPLQIPIYFSKKKNKPVNFILNLNNFRNSHYRILNDAKVKYKEIITPQLKDVKKMLYVAMVYTIHKGDKRKFDIGNISCIHQKFLEDAMVENDKLFDDNCRLIPLVIEKYGDVDTDNPRVDVDIYNLMLKEDVDALRKVIDEYINSTLERIAYERANPKKKRTKKEE